MADESILDRATLLAPIPGDDPAGVTLPFAVGEELDEARKEIDPADFDANDPARPEEAKRADWGKVVRVATRTLTETSKDLGVAARLTEALTRRDGFPGLAEGLDLLAGLVEECWDRMYPPIDPEDPEVRAGPLTRVGDSSRRIDLPNAVRHLPLIVGTDGAVSWHDWKQSTQGKGVGKAEVDRVLASSAADDCRKTAADLDRCQATFRALSEALTARLGNSAPGLGDLRSAVEDCATLARQVAQQKGDAPAEAPAAESGEVEATAPVGGGRAGGPAGPPATRAEAYRRLAEAAEVLQRLEPHSPIPYLLRRAVALGAMPFPQLMRVLLKDASGLDELDRELGVAPPE